MSTMAKPISSGKLKKAEFMEVKIMWIVEYTSTDKFIKDYGFSLTIRQSFKSECEAIKFINQVKNDDTNNNTSRTIMIYNF